MSPIQIVKYLETVFKNDKNVKMTVIDDIDVIKKEYPLAHAVTRASLAGKYWEAYNLKIGWEKKS